MDNANALRTFLEQAYGKKLSDKEALEYKDRLTKFFSLLIEIDQRIKKESSKKQK